MRRGRDMAIPRVFDSSTPFVLVAGGSELSFPGKEDAGQECEEKDSLTQAIGPQLSLVMQRGTAKHVVTAGRQEPEDGLCLSIVAQAEREDFQEFSPTNTQCPFSRSQLLKKHRSLVKEAALLSDSEDEDDAAALPLHHLQRKQRRKSRRQIQGDGEEPPIIRGLWVQEIDWLKAAGEMTSSADIIPPPPQFTDSASLPCSCEDECATGSEDQDQDQDQDWHRPAETEDSSSDSRGDSDLEQDSESVYTHESESDSSCAAEDATETPHGMLNVTFDLMHVSGFTCCSPAEWDSDSCSHSTGNISQSAFGSDDLSDAEAAWDGLRGGVSHVPKLCVSPVFRELIKQTLSSWKTCTPANEGLLFHHRLQPDGSRYREGEEYRVLHHIQNGSYGDVFCVRDRRTGFTCAAKRVPLSHFSSQEVMTWSAVSSQRVVELFGAVREGLNAVLFMDLKPACLAQLLKEMDSLPEDLALHYLHQTLGALEHLHHRNILHLDVKVDNVLLSADCRDTFLCDFGLAETLDDSGASSRTFRGAAFPGTETHMAPEVARGARRCAKADVWSSCCMLLHMLNGCQPWTRLYCPPLCLQIVNEPPPLWEVPSNCNNFTAKVFRAGLQKDPDRRASARELRRKTTKALRAVGGLSPWSVKRACETLLIEDSPGISPPGPPASMSWVSPWRTSAVHEDSRCRDSDPETDSVTRDWEPKPLQEDWSSLSDSELDIYMAEEEHDQERWLRSEREYEGDWEEEEEDEEEEEEERDSSVSTEYHRALRGIFPLLQKGQQMNENSWGSEPELEFLRDDVPPGATIRTPSPEPRDDPPSCFSCSGSSQLDASEDDSARSSDDLSSGVFSSCSSQTDGRLQWLASDNQPSSCCFEGVDIWIENVQGECLRIRERRQVKVGHVAIGISDQVSGKAFTLETLDRKPVSLELEVGEPCVWLRCVPAADSCRRWSWRVRDGKLEQRE